MTAAAIVATVALVVTNACALYWRHRARQLQRQIREWQQHR